MIARSQLVAAWSLAASCWVCVPAVANPYTWNNPAGGNFNEAVNWLPTGVPGAADAAVFSMASAYAVTNSEAHRVCSLSFLGGSVEFNGGALSHSIVRNGVTEAVLIVDASSQLSTSLTFRNGSLSLCDFDSATFADVVIGAGPGATSVTLTDEGTSWSLGGNVFIGSSLGGPDVGVDSLTVRSGAVISDTLPRASFDARLTLNPTAKAEIVDAGSLLNVRVASLRPGSGLLVGAGARANAEAWMLEGTLQVTGPGSRVTDEIALSGTGAGSIDLSSFATARIHSAGTSLARLSLSDHADFDVLGTPMDIANLSVDATSTINDTVNLRAGATGRVDGGPAPGDVFSLTVFAGATFSGSGSASDLVSGGLLSPGGDSTGTLHIGSGPGTAPKFQQLSTGVLLVRLGGPTPGEQHDTLDVAGSAVLNGTLAVSLKAPFVPGVGDRFTVVTSHGISGQFAALSLPELPPTRRMVVVYENNAVTVRTVCRLDWNNDGGVNAGDVGAFLADWFDAVQTNDSAADFNSDGVVNSGDLTGFLLAWFLVRANGC